MKISTYTNNQIILEGRIANINEYSKNKAANVTITVDNGKDKNGVQRAPAFIQTKSFTPASYNAARVGMKVRIYGHIMPNNHKKDHVAVIEKQNGVDVAVIKDNVEVYETDLICDYIDFLESKATVESREAAKA